LPPTQTGDAARLRDLLAASAVLHSDCGGHERAALRIITGGDRILRFFVGLARKARAAGASTSWFKFVRINGLPGYINVGPGDVLQTTALDVRGGVVTAVRNPDKLAGPAALAPRQSVA
jgi:RNA polymerase sigma-70 factor, ECF subfamily